MSARCPSAVCPLGAAAGVDFANTTKKAAKKAALIHSSKTLDKMKLDGYLGMYFSRAILATIAQNRL